MKTSENMQGQIELFLRFELFLKLKQAQYLWNVSFKRVDFLQFT